MKVQTNIQFFCLTFCTKNNGALQTSILSPATDAGQNTQHLFSLVTKGHLNWWWFFKSQLRINKTIHRENQMFAFGFYTNLSTQTVLTAGQLHQSSLHQSST